MVGRKYGNEGIGRRDAKLVPALAAPLAPKAPISIGGSFGGGKCGMRGRRYMPRILWIWPNARINIMGGEQAAGMLATVRRDSLETQGSQWSTEEEPNFNAPVLTQFDHPTHPICVRTRLRDGGVKGLVGQPPPADPGLECQPEPDPVQPPPR